MRTAEFLNAVDHAAGMSDRWLFLAAFLLLLLLCGAAIYWLVRQLQAVISDHKSSWEAHQTALSDIIKNQNETALKLAICIDRNTQALEKCTFELQRLQKQP
jgi:predicted PurR-regulated permease PerM